MKVYHGSWMEIAEPDLKHSRTDVDFGKRILYNSASRAGR